jgi:hypothetical protein
MAYIDEKLAKGYARQATRAWLEAGARLRAGSFRVAQALAREAQENAAGRLTHARFNVVANGLFRSAAACPGIAMAAMQKAGPGSAGNYMALAMRQADVVHVRGDGLDYSAREITFGFECLALFGRRPAFRFGGLPLLVDGHFVSRWIERTGQPDPSSLPRTLGACLPIARLYMEAASITREGEAEIAVPVDGGLVLGGTERVACDGLADSFLFGSTQIETSFELRAGESRLERVACLKTFMDAALLSDEQRRAAESIRAWIVERAERIRGDSSLLTGHRPKDTALVEEFLPVMRRVQEAFLSWRGMLRSQGYDGTDFEALRESWACPPVPPLTDPDDPDLERRVARIVGVHPAEVRIRTCMQGQAGSPASHPARPGAAR